MKDMKTANAALYDSLRKAYSAERAASFAYVGEYFIMLRQFRELGIKEHEAALYEMGVREKEHEVYFQKVIEGEPWLPLFEKVFSWGEEATLNDVDYDDLRPVEDADQYCTNYKKGNV